MSRVIHFEIHADDVERARDFYEKVFGWTHEKHEHGEHWLCKTGPNEKMGINGVLIKREIAPVPGGFSTYVCTIGIDDIDATIKLVEQHKGKCVRPKRAIKGVGWYSHCIDTEGNIFGLMQADPNAA